MANVVNFYNVSTLAKYEGLTRDNNTLYFVNDAKRIYKGDIDVTENVVVVTSFGEASAAFEGKLYINITSFETRIISNGAWVTLSPGYLTDGANWAEADGNKFATIALIKSAITAALGTISTDATFDNAAGTIKVGDGTAATLTGVAHDITYENLTITIPTYGGEATVINLPKDNFVRSGSYDADTQEIVLVVDDENSDTDENTTEIRIPAAELVDVYTADNTNKDIEITVSADNKISATAKISSTAGNALTTTDDGLMVDISGKMNIVYVNGTPVTINTTADITENDTTTVPVGSLIAKAIAAAISAAKTELQTAIDGKIAKMTDATEDAIVLATADGQVKPSTTKLTDLATAKQMTDMGERVEAVEAAITWTEM